MYLDRKPTRRAASVVQPDTTAPRKKLATRPPQQRASRAAPAPAAEPPRSQRSAAALPKWVTLPVAWEVTTAQTMNVMTFVYPATHDSEIASRDFWRK